MSEKREEMVVNCALFTDLYTICIWLAWVDFPANSTTEHLGLAFDMLF